MIEIDADVTEIHRNLIKKMIGCVSHGAIIGLEGYTWDATPGYYLNENECFNFIKVFDKSDLELQKNIEHQGITYKITSQYKNIIIAQYYVGNIFLVKCKRCIVYAYTLAETEYDISETTQLIEEIGNILDKIPQDCYDKL